MFQVYYIVIDSCIHYGKITMISLVTTCPHTKLLQYFLRYSLCCILHLHALLVLFYNWRFVPLNTVQLFLPLPLLWQPRICLQCLLVGFGFVLFFRFLYVSEIIWCLYFSVWLISLCIVPSRSIHVVTSVKNVKISFLCVTRSYFTKHVYIHTPPPPYLFYPLICWWTLRLLLYLGNCK